MFYHLIEYRPQFSKVAQISFILDAFFVTLDRLEKAKSGSTGLLIASVLKIGFCCFHDCQKKHDDKY